MNDITKEERPDVMAGKPEVANLPMPGEPGSENLHYRSVEINKATEDAGRYDKHKGLDYGVARKVGRMLVMACDKAKHEARIKKAGKKSADRITEPAQPANRNRTSFGGRDINTIETGKGPETVFHDN